MIASVIFVLHHSVLIRKAASCHTSIHKIRRLALGRVQSDDSCQAKKL